jgi:hypothetical protein
MIVSLLSHLHIFFLFSFVAFGNFLGSSNAASLSSGAFLNFFPLLQSRDGM